MPDTILDVDYIVGHDVSGGWLDLQAVLSGILVQGAAAHSPLERLEGVQTRATRLLEAVRTTASFRCSRHWPTCLWDTAPHMPCW